MRSMRVDDSCPYCKNRKLLRGFNDLATAHPWLAAEWDWGAQWRPEARRRGVQFDQAGLVEGRLRP